MPGSIGDPHDLEAPSAWVVRWAGLIPRAGRVLDLACGGGRHARFFASRGHPVEATDRDPAVLARLADVPGVAARCADLESGPWPYEGERFAGIVVVNYLHRPLFPHLLAALAAGGALIYETFAAGNERYGRPSNPRFLLHPGELWQAFGVNLRVLAFEQGLGKTLVAIESFGRLRSQGEVDTMVVICPNSLKRTWAVELTRFAPHLEVYIAESNRKSRRDGLATTRAAVVLINYESARNEIVALQAAGLALAVSLLAGVGIDEADRAVTEGSLLGGYRFHAYKTSEDEERRPEVVEIVGGDEEPIRAATIASEATNLARDWMNTPAGDKSPAALAAMMAEAAVEAGVESEVWDRARIEEEGLGAVLGVAAGSDRDPHLINLSYTPEEAAVHLALVGKGITFDTGGLSLKTPALMEEMKIDMSGAAVAVAATTAIARMGLPVRITCLAPLTDNAVGGDATRPGDVLRPVAGPTIEVLNTDAEGRLILADGLALARRAEPDLIVDVATLTGAARVALGDQIGAVFGSDTEVADRLLVAASRAGELFWEMPLAREYRKLLDSEVADIKNISGSRYGGAIVAALFLAEYAGDHPWAHLDIAGPARSRETSGELVKGGSGFGVRTLVELGREMAVEQ